jgi:quercetin 2,3-dioxygenase
VLAPREVPLGGVRAITVRRTLPHRDRSFVGAWCFADHYGPQRIEADGHGSMDVPPHPHAGLQTVSWLFAGEIEHRDSAGVQMVVAPGELNLMTAGSGIAHSEVSVGQAKVLHGVQLWVALPESALTSGRGFDHYVPSVVPLAHGAGSVRVFIGGLPGLGESPVTTFTPLVGAQIDLEPHASVALQVSNAFEHGVLVDRGDVTLGATSLVFGDLGVVDAGAATLELQAGAEGVRLILLGGEPFDEEIVMWWNFIARSHEEIVAMRNEWEADDSRFGQVVGYEGPVDRIPAPTIPAVRLRPRGRRGRATDLTRR